MEGVNEGLATINSLGGGLAALAFWGFIAAVSVGGIWDGINKRETEQETIRRIIESSKDIDEVMLNKIIAATKGESSKFGRDFKLASLWIMPIAFGLIPFGWFLSSVALEAGNVMYGISAMLFCLSIGFWLASNVIEKLYSSDLS